MNKNARMVITPTCRYGHGDLVEIPVPPTLTDQGQGRPVQGEHAWAFNSSILTRFAGTDIFFTDTGIASFTFMLFRCETCGYMELFDPPDSKEAPHVDS